MGTVIGRTRKDGSKAFTAQIVIKKGGVIVHREAETFDRKQAANAWIVKREAELKRPDGLERKEDPTLAVVIDRYIEESRNAVLGTKAQVLKTIKNSDLGETKCSEIVANKLVSFARELTKNVEPQTCGTTSPVFQASSRSRGRLGAIRCHARSSTTRLVSSGNWDWSEKPPSARAGRRLRNLIA